MLLLLSSKKPANSSYVTETGQILYKVNRRKPTTGPVIIRKAVGTVQGVWHGDSGTHELPDRIVSQENSTAPEVEGQLLDETENDPSSSTEGPKFEGHFAFSAQIEFNAFANSRFQYNSLDVPMQTYLRREGWHWTGWHRVFKADDGQEYRWERRVGRGYLLFKNDGSETPVARFTDSKPNLGPLMSSRQASLDVDPSCEPILDEIIMTFIYLFLADGHQ